MPDRVIVAALAPLAGDARVRRHCRALTAAGYDVTAIAIGDPNDPAVRDGKPKRILVPQPTWRPLQRVKLSVRLLALRGHVGDAALDHCAQLVPGVASLTDAVLAETAKAPSNTTIVANDWTALPAAIEANRRFSTPFHYDSHEFAVEEHAHQWRWRLLFPPLVDALERRGLAIAHSASTVSAGIADAMAARYGLATPPAVLMSIPDTPPRAPRPAGAQIDVLYHGLFLPGRGIESLATAAAGWPAHINLTLRGRPGSPAVAASIAAATAPAIAAGRLTMAPMVPQSDVITAANAADIGVFLPNLSLRQNRFALPNKLFEYLFAGLVPVVPDATDMATLLHRLDAGVILDDPAPAGLSRWLRALTTEQLATEKARVQRAAAVLAREGRETSIATLLHSPVTQ